MPRPRLVSCLAVVAVFVVVPFLFSWQNSVSQPHIPDVAHVPFFDNPPCVGPPPLATNASTAWADLLHPNVPCPNGERISVLWVIKHMWGSALWSGYDIADAIGGNGPSSPKRFPDIVCLPLQVSEIGDMNNEQLLDLFVKHGQSTEKRRLDLCLFLKFPDAQVLARCRELGAKTAILWVDGHPNLLHQSDFGLKHTSDDHFDFHILPNTLTTQHYGKAMSGSEWVIPQHDSNVRRLRKSDPSQPVRVIGWQGGPENRMSSEVRDAISGWAKERGIEFRELFYKGVSSTRHELEIERDNTFAQVAGQVDIMIIFPSGKETFEKLIYKPNGRNIFSLSMGIPTVLFPYVSYTEGLKWSAYPAFASSIPELLRWLDLLTSSPDARVNLSQLGIQFSERLSLDNVARMWAFHLREALCRHSTGQAITHSP